MTTRHAVYILRNPGDQYRDLFARKMRLVNLTALLLSLGHDHMNAPEAETLDEFMAIAGGVALGGNTCTKSHIKSAVRCDFRP